MNEKLSARRHRCLRHSANEAKEKEGQPHLPLAVGVTSRTAEALRPHADPTHSSNKTAGGRLDVLPDHAGFPPPRVGRLAPEADHEPGDHGKDPGHGGPERAETIG